VSSRHFITLPVSLGKEIKEICEHTPKGWNQFRLSFNYPRLELWDNDLIKFLYVY